MVTSVKLAKGSSILRRIIQTKRERREAHKAPEDRGRLELMHETAERRTNGRHELDPIANG